MLQQCLTFSFVVFIVVVLCPISYSTRSLLGLYFPNSSSLSLNLSKFTLVFDFVLANSNPSIFLHYYSCALCNMVTFHAIGRLNLIVMVDESGMTIVFEHWLYNMFAFQPCSLHISKDISYVCQIFNIFWEVNFYQIFLKYAIPTHFNILKNIIIIVEEQ